MYGKSKNKNKNNKFNQSKCVYVVQRKQCSVAVSLYSQVYVCICKQNEESEAGEGSKNAENCNSAAQTIITKTIDTLIIKICKNNSNSKTNTRLTENFHYATITKKSTYQQNYRDFQQARSNSNNISTQTHTHTYIHTCSK